MSMQSAGPVRERVEQLADQVALRLGLEIVEVEVKGGGSQRVVRVTIDKPDSTKDNGVTHADCEALSRALGDVMDAEDVIPGEDAYTLEVSSPGVERKLTRPRDFERFVGEKVKITLKSPVEGTRLVIGTLQSFLNGTLRVDAGDGKQYEFPLDQVSKANLKYDW